MFLIFELKRKSTKIYLADENGLLLQLRTPAIRPVFANPVTYVIWEVVGGKPGYISPPKRNVSPQTISKLAKKFILIIKKILNSYEFCFNNKKIVVTII